MKEEGSGASLSDNNISDGLQSQIGSSKIPDFWAKQFQLQQTQQFMYSYTMPNGGNMMQQQQLLPVPLSMPYGAHGSAQQQPYLYMQQAQQPSGSIPAGYSYELNNSGHSGDEGMHQLSRYGSQSGYPRQQQLPQSREQGQRGGSWSGGNRNDKSRSTDNSSGSSSTNHQQQQDDLYIPLDNNGEISSRSSNQRPPEGEPSLFSPLPPHAHTIFPVFLRIIVFTINSSDILQIYDISHDSY